MPVTVIRKNSDSGSKELQLSITPKRKFSLLNILKMSQSPAMIGISMDNDVSETIHCKQSKMA